MNSTGWKVNDRQDGFVINWNLRNSGKGRVIIYCVDCNKKFFSCPTGQLFHNSMFQDFDIARTNHAMTKRHRYNSTLKGLACD